MKKSFFKIMWTIFGNESVKDVRSHVQIASDRMKQYYYIRAQEGGYKEGNQVWMHSLPRKEGFSPKLQQRWGGLYRTT